MGLFIDDSMLGQVEKDYDIGITIFPYYLT
ncbi:MAG: hypothetical protein Barrevirus19_2 [Barrevirus sp.]|uniref:Uncharacterized protein n=1 Tax=Barrevirus sp. TaxID=2487763 RepID=A0A3G4ZQN9_9VIRU|nr:MAG: hypothetical protein Barrevirus19_2 [Barrevirus sp.]